MADVGKKTTRVRATLYVSLDVLDEARDAAVHLAGYPARLTLAARGRECLASRVATSEGALQRWKGFSSTRRRPQRWPPYRGLTIMHANHPKVANQTELEKLRQELLRKILRREARRKTPVEVSSK